MRARRRGRRVPWHAGGAEGGDGGPGGWPEPAVVGEKPAAAESACRWVASMAPHGGAAWLGDGARSGR
jgi:hypothetical protein